MDALVRAAATPLRDETGSPPRSPALETSEARPATLVPDAPPALMPARLLNVLVLEAGRPAAGAWVELTHEPARSTAGSDPSSILVRATDEHGNVAFELEGGQARIVAWKDDLTAPPLRVDLGQEQDVTLSLEVGWTVAGRVVDARTGQAVADARVAFWTFAESDTVHTAPDGTFRHPRFPHSAPAQQIEVRAAGFGSSVRYLKLRADGTWKLSAVLAGEASVEGAGIPWIELALVPEVRVRGRVMGLDRTPLAGARVSAEGFFHVMPSVASRDSAEVETDELGRFELEGLRSDVGHSLLVEAPGHAHRAFELEAGTENVLDLGELVLDRETVLAGAVVDMDGRPLAEVTVRLSLAAPADPVRERSELDVAVRLESRERRTCTGPEGTFLFENLGPKVVRLALETEDGLRDMGEFAPRPDGTYAAPCLVLEPAWMAEVASRR